MKIQEKKNLTITNCTGSLSRGNFYSCASYFCDLLEAEKYGIISSKWRHEIDVDRIRKFVTGKMEVIRKRWKEDFNHLNNIITYGGKLEDEEVMFVLTTMSTLQSITSTLFREYIDDIERLYVLLGETIDNNTIAVDYCRRRKTIGIESCLPNHWWWRTNTPDVGGSSISA